MGIPEMLQKFVSSCADVEDNGPMQEATPTRETRLDLDATLSHLQFP